MQVEHDPTASMTDEQRLAWFEAQAEAAYGDHAQVIAPKVVQRLARPAADMKHMK
jgi:hypothetical protein